MPPRASPARPPAPNRWTDGPMDPGSQVQLTAVAASGTYFTTWGGDCSGTLNSCFSKDTDTGSSRHVPRAEATIGGPSSTLRQRGGAPTGARWGLLGIPGPTGNRSPIAGGGRDRPVSL